MNILTQKLIEKPELAKKLLESEKLVMEMIALGRPLNEVLSTIALSYEEHTEQGICSILLMADDGIHVKHGAGPSLPHAFNEGIDGEPIGPVAGSCGTAAFRKERVIVADIAEDPLWINYRDFALSFGLKACWSTPILSYGNKVLGTFAIYYNETRSPGAEDFELVDRAANQVKIALERHQKEIQLQESEEKYRSLAESIPDYVMRYDIEGRHTYMNPAALKICGLTEAEVIGKTHREAGFEEAQSAFWEEKIKYVFETGNTVQEQFEWDSVEGSVFLDWRLSPEFDGAGNVKSVLGVSRDITKLKKAENEIREREQLFFEVTSRFPSSYLSVVDKDLRLVFNGGEEFLKQKLDPFHYIGLRVQDVFAPFGEKVVGKIVKSYQKTFDGEPQNFELTIGDQIQLYKTAPLKSVIGSVDSILVVAENITEKRKAQITLAKSESLYRNLTSIAPTAIFQADKNGHFTFVNEAWIKMSGLEFEESMGLGWTEVLHPEDKDSVLNEWLSTAAAGAEFNAELRLFRKDGIIVWITFKAVPLFDANESNYGCIGTASDITEQKKINEVIEQSEERYRTTLSRITDGFVALDENWCYTYMNKKAGEIFNCKPEEIIGKHIWTEFPEGIGQPFHGAYMNAMLEQKYTYLEEYYQPYDKWFENHIYPSPEGLSIYFKDISDRKKAEEEILQAKTRLELAEVQAKLGSWELGVKSGESIWSNQMYQIFEFDHAKEPPHRERLIERIHPEDREEFAFKLSELFEGHEVGVKVFRTNPEILPLKYLLPTYRSERDENGVIIKYIGTIQDISDLVVADKSLKASEEKFRQLAENIEDVFFMSNPEKSIIEYISPAYEKVWGNTVESLFSNPKSFIDAVLEEDKPALLASMEKLKKGTLDEVEYRILNAQGEIRNILSSAYPIKDAQGRVFRIAGIAKDITQRKKIEIAVRESEEKYRTLIEQASDGILMIDAQGYITLVNSALCSILGYTEAELLKMTIDDTYPIEDKISAGSRREKIAKEGYLSFERNMVRKDGALVPVEITVSKTKDDKQLGIVRDISERKRADEKLNEERSKLSKISTTIPGLIGSFKIETDGSFYFPYVSQAIVDIYGFTPEEAAIDAKPIFKLVHAEDKKNMIESAQSATNLLAPWKHEYRYHHPVKGLVWLEGNFVPVRERDGSTIWHGVTMDITERKRDEQKILVSEEKYRTLIEQAADAILVVDLEGNCEEANESASVLTGYDSNELTRMNYIQLISPSDLEVKPLNMDEIRGCGFEFIERVFKKKDGELINVDIRCKLMKTDKINVIIRDISDRIEQEQKRMALHQRINQTINTMLDGFILADQKGDIIEVNPSYCALIGYTRDELVSMNINKLEAELTQEEINSRIAHMYDKKSVRLETLHKKKDGELISLEVSISIMDFGGEALVAAFIRDITEKKKAQQELQRNHEQLRLLTAHLQEIREEERAALSRELHDELGQQLTAIKMDLSWVNKRMPQDEVLFNKIDNTIQLTNHAVSTIRRINSDLRPTMLDDLGLFGALEYQINEFSKRFDVKVQFNIETEEPRFERASEIAIFRVFQEALTNVAKHAKAKKVVASVRKNFNMIELTIIDDGVGFDRTKIGGLKSFGLLGMTERAMMINGSLEIDSKPGLGTTVRLSVPLLES